MCRSKTSKLGRKRQEPSSTSKISLCCWFFNNSYKVTTTALKNFLWHRRDENTDTEVIGLSKWIYCVHLCRHKLSLVFDRVAHPTMEDPIVCMAPWPFPLQGWEWWQRKWVSPPPLLTWLNPTPMLRWQNWKASISTVKKFLPSIPSC